MERGRASKEARTLQQDRERGSTEAAHGTTPRTKKTQRHDTSEASSYASEETIRPPRTINRPTPDFASVFWRPKQRGTLFGKLPATINLTVRQVRSGGPE